MLIWQKNWNRNIRQNSKIVAYYVAKRERGVTIVGIYRQDVYEIPPEAIRELIINAMVHRLWKAFHNRCYLDHGTIQVAVYDNRLEITSPGKLPMRQTWSV